MNINSFTVSMVSIDDSLIEKVATKCSTTVEKVKDYLQSSQQDDELLRAFLFYGVGPFNKLFASSSINKDRSTIVSMGARVDGVW